MKRTATILLCVILILSTFLPLYFSSSGGLVLSENQSEELCFVDDENVYISASPKTMNSDGYVYFNVTSKDLEGEVDFCVGFKGINGYPASLELYDPREEVTQFEFDINPYLDDPNCVVDYNYTKRERNILRDGFVWSNRNMSIVDDKNHTIGWEVVQVLMQEYDVLDLSTGVGYWSVSETMYWRDISSNGELEKESFDFMGMETWYSGNSNIQKNKEYYLRMWLTLVPTLNPEIHEYYVAIKPSNKNYQQASSNDQLYYLDPWYSSTWTYRKSHVINNATDAGTNYQVRIEVYNVTGTDSGDQVYCGVGCNDDFSDIRFTDNDGSTALDYWLEKPFLSNHAVFWVEILDDISDIDGIIYIYYGKYPISTTSNFDNTFVFGDPFDSETIDASRWPTITGNPDYNIDSSYHTLEVYDIDTYSWWNGKGFKSKFLTLPDSWIIEDAYGENQPFWMLHYTDSNYDIFGSLFNVEHGVYSTSDYGVSHTTIRDHWSANKDWLNWAGVGGNTDYNSGTQTYSSYVLKDFMMWKLDGDIHIEIDDNEEVDESNSENEYYVCLGLSRYAGYTFGFERFSAFKVRKYVSPEPTHGDWGPEQQWYDWQEEEYASTIWGTQWYDLAPDGELSVSEDVCEDIYNLFDDTGLYDKNNNYWGDGTLSDYFYLNASDCEDNYDFATLFYKGHIYPFDPETYDCGKEDCNFDFHYGIYDNMTGPIADHKIYENLTSTDTFDFVFIWACKHAANESMGGLDGTHSFGMAYSLMGENDTTLNYDGYTYPDNNGRCFISFDSISINFMNITTYDSYNYGHFAYLFYYYALSGGVFSINDALNLSAEDTHGTASYGLCQLHTGYNMDDAPDPEEECHMRIWGDGNLIIPS